MTAKEARTKALSIKEKIIKNQYMLIKKLINSAVDDGELEIIYEDSIYESVQREFESEGYIFNDVGDFDDGYDTKISW